MTHMLLMFCLGSYAIIAQAVMLRELLTAFSGNELTIGAMLGIWFAGVGVGAAVARLVVSCRERVLKILIMCLFVALAFMLPLQVFLSHIIRSLTGIAPGEYASFGRILRGVAVLLAPTGICVGMSFPCVCAVFKQRNDSVVGQAYFAEAAGSMVGGLVFSLLLVSITGSFACAGVAGGLCMLGASCVSGRRSAGTVMALTGVCLIAFLVVFDKPLSRVAAEARWKSAGLLSAGAGDYGANARLVASVNSRYQNLALIESLGQYTLYGNGEPVFSFPDRIAAEHKIHFIMAQNPDPGRILLVGGNPVDYVPELMKYNPEELVCVYLDPAVARVVLPHSGTGFQKALQDPRVRMEHVDAVRYVKKCGKNFDVVIIDTPGPTTTALNRFYTESFYRDVARLLGTSGFMYTAVEASVRLGPETAPISASVYTTLQSVFENVLVTAGSENRFFASISSGILTFDRNELMKRSAGADLDTEYFRPEYFFAIDDIDVEKVNLVRARLSEIDAPLNTILRPVSCFYELVIWCRYSGSAIGKVLKVMEGVSAGMLVKPVLWVGLCLCVLYMGLCVTAKVGGRGSGDRDGRDKGLPGRLAVSGRKGVLVLCLLVTGFCVMGIEIMLVFLFQGIYGYIYARIAMIAGLFMFGLMTGSLASGKVSSRESRGIGALLALESALLAICLLVPGIVGLFLSGGGEEASLISPQLVIYLLVMLTGGIAGAQFPLVTRLYRFTGEGLGASSAVMDAADHIGACAGSFVMGVFFIPVLGIGMSCAILGALKIVTLLLVASAAASICFLSQAPTCLLTSGHGNRPIKEKPDEKT